MVRRLFYALVKMLAVPAGLLTAYLLVVAITPPAPPTAPSAGKGSGLALARPSSTAGNHANPSTPATAHPTAQPTHRATPAPVITPYMPGPRPTPTPVATPRPTPTPASTPTPGPTTTPTPGPTPTATPRPTPTPTPTPTPATTPSPTPTPTPVPVGPGIRVAGNHLVDGSGRIVTLHGADFSGTEFVCIQQGTPTSRGWGIYGGPADQASTYQAMRAWHINAVRVPLNEDCWLGINGVNPIYGGASYQNAIKLEVNAINQAGMVAILDLHWSSPGSWAAMNQQPVPDRDHSPAFWQSVATTFRNQPNVIFDLYNEPYLYSAWMDAPSDPSGWACWRNGCQMNTFVSSFQNGTNYQTSFTWQSAGMQTLINTVRATGANNPLLVNGLGWANDPSGWLAAGLTDPAGQLIAGIHSYPGQGCVFPRCWTDTNNNGPVQPIGAKVPIIVGETGDSAPGPVTYMNQELPFLDSVGVSYVAWTWNPWQDPNFVLIKDWSGTPTAGEGAYYRSHLISTFP